MVTNAEKFVRQELIDTWSRGSPFLSRLQNLGPVIKSGDACDVPYPAAAATVNITESASVETIATSALAFAVNRPKVINQAITNFDDHALLSGNYLSQMVRAKNGDLVNAVERDMIEYLICNAGESVNNHFNLAADAITDDDVASAEAYMLQQDGTTHDDLLWLVSPQAVASLRSVADYIPSDPGSRDALGRALPASLNGIPLLIHNGVPGGANRYTISGSGSVTSNVQTVTVSVPAGSDTHGFVTGQMIYTTGFTVNRAVTSPDAINSTTATTIVHDLTACNGANGTGLVTSASGFAMLLNTKRIFYAFVGAYPQSFLIKREAVFGHALQLGTFFGRICLDSSCAIVHTPDGI